MASGSQHAVVTYTEGDKLALPDNPTGCSEREFVGWIAANSYSHATEAPEFITAGSTVDANATYYAVYALKTAGNANSITVKQSSFTAVAASMDSYISYAAEQGTATSAPGVYSNIIRIYQNGGILNVNAKTGAKITSVTIGSSMATSVTYKVDAGSESSEQSACCNSRQTAGSSAPCATAMAPTGVPCPFLSASPPSFSFVRIMITTSTFPAPAAEDSTLAARFSIAEGACPEESKKLPASSAAARITPACGVSTARKRTRRSCMPSPHPFTR
jgi:hypothetical protein